MYFGKTPYNILLKKYLQFNIIYAISSHFQINKKGTPQGVPDIYVIYLLVSSSTVWYVSIRAASISGIPMKIPPYV